MPKKKKKPRFNSVEVMVVEIEDRNEGRVATLHHARLLIDELFAGMGFDPATRVKNLRHLQSFNPRQTVKVALRGQSPREVPLNRVRLDPDNSVGDRPHLRLLPFGTYFHGSRPTTAPSP